MPAVYPTDEVGRRRKGRAVWCGDPTRPSRHLPDPYCCAEGFVAVRTVGYVIPSCSRYVLYFVGS